MKKLLILLILFLNLPIYASYNGEINNEWVCFVAGTSITLVDKNSKSIEEIKVGDEVLSWDEKTGEFQNAKVVKTFEKIATELIKIELENNKIIESTPEHPFYTSKGWISAKEIKPNDLIKGINGFIAVKSASLEERSPVKVYKFEVEGRDE